MQHDNEGLLILPRDVRSFNGAGRCTRFRVHDEKKDARFLLRTMLESYEIRRPLWDLLWEEKRVKNSLAKTTSTSTYRIIKRNAKFLQLGHGDIGTPRCRVAGAAEKHLGRFHYRITRTAIRLCLLLIDQNLFSYSKRAFRWEWGDLEWLLTILIGSGTAQRLERDQRARKAFDTHLNLRKSAARMENSPNERPLQYRMFDEYSLALRSMSLTASEKRRNVWVRLSLSFFRLESKSSLQVLCFNCFYL